MAPLLAGEIPVKGIAVFGTVARTWHEYMIENVRRQLALSGTDFAEIDRELHRFDAFEHYIKEGLSPTEIAAQHPELKKFVDENYTEGKYYLGTHYTYFRQLAGLNLAEAWQRFGGRVLSAWGESDFISGESDHALIASIVNAAHPGHAEFRALDEIDHGFHKAVSQEVSFRTNRQTGRDMNPVFLATLRDWTTKVWAAGQ